MSEKLEKIKSLSLDRKEKKFPEIEMTFVYSPHATEKDAKLITDKLPKTDIFCPEIEGGKDELIENLNKISQGEKEIFEKYMANPPFTYQNKWRQVFCALYNSKKIVWPIDLNFPADTDLILMLDEAAYKYQLSLNSFLQGNFDKAVEQRKQFVKQTIPLEKIREKIILKALEELPANLSKRYPQLKNRKKLKVLVSLGAAHTWIYHQLKRKDRYDLKRNLNKNPYIFSFGGRIWRRGRFIAEDSFEQGSVERSLMEDMLEIYLRNFSRDSADVALAARIIAERMDVDFIKRISIYLGKYTKISPRILVVALTDFLRQCHISVPRNEEEMKKIIKDYKKKKFGPQAIK